MKRFVFFLIILLAIMSFLFYGLFKGKSNAVGNVSESDGYAIAKSVNQHFSLVQKSDNVFTLAGQVADGTHNQLMVKLISGDGAETYQENVIDITDQPFEYDLTMPEGKSNTFLNMYYNEGMGITISVNTIFIMNENGKWKVVENENTQANTEILSKLKYNDYVYSDDELKDIPQGLLTLTDTICNGHTDDMSKAYAMYVWCCEHLYRNMTEANAEKSLEYVYNTRIADVEAMANFYAAMLRIQGIPTAIVECDGGYKFNAAYINNEWIYIQLDRNVFNNYTAKQYVYSRTNLYTSFNVPIDMLSANYLVKSYKK